MSSKIGNTNRFESNPTKDVQGRPQSTLRGREVSQKEPSSQQANTYGKRLTNVVDGSTKNVERGVQGAVFGVLKAVTGGTLVVVGTGTLMLSEYRWTGALLVVGGVVLAVVGAGQTVIELMRTAVGVRQLVTAPLLAANPVFNDPKNSELRFRWESNN